MRIVHVRKDHRSVRILQISKMQGINKAKHVHLIDALLNLENILDEDFKMDMGRQHASTFRQELELLFADYDKKIAGLAELIDSYEDLFHKAKVQFLSPKLKELRKKAEHDAKVFPLLIQNIRMVYGT